MRSTADSTARSRARSSRAAASPRRRLSPRGARRRQRAGSPADLGGLRAGDVIVVFGGKVVKDLYSYSDALYTHRPGDGVEVVYVRSGQRHTTTVTLGTRGQ